MASNEGNAWCEALGIAPPRLEAVVGHREAHTFALLLVALLERGRPMTLLDVAARFEEAGVSDRSSALLSLKRCKPGRPPVYREGDLYHLDPHDAELGLWAFRLGLRPPHVVRPPPRAVEQSPIPDPDTALTVRELDEAWKDASLRSWSSQRLVVAVLDAQGGPLTPAEVVAAVATRTRWHGLKEDAAKFKRSNSAVVVLADGRWALAADADEAVVQAREAVRERVAIERRHAATHPDPIELKRRQAEWAEKRAAHGAELAGMSRALLVAFPPSRPQAAVLLDVHQHSITTFVGDELAALPARLAGYESIGAVDVRGVLRALGFDAGERRLAELGPPQKTKTLNRQGRTLQITTALLVQGSCGISRPFGEEAALAGYLAKGELTKLRRRLEADVKSLYALYEYGRLHGTVRLRWGFLDERLPAPWVHHDETRLYHLKEQALTTGQPLEVVLGSAPGWDEPWARARLVHARREANHGWTWLVDDAGFEVNEAEVQRARPQGERY